MAQSSAQLLAPPPGTRFPSARYVDWLQVQGFLDMAESALRAKNAANDILMREKTASMQHLSHQTEQNIQEVRHGQAEDTTFLRQQLEALLRERAAAKEQIAGLERENSFLLDEREILFRQLEVEAGTAETDRHFRSFLSVRKSEEDLSALRHEALHPRGRHHNAMEPMTPQDSAEGARALPGLKAAVRGDDHVHATNVQHMQEAAYAHPGRNSEYDGADLQHVSSPNSRFGPFQLNGHLRQPLQARFDHGNAVHLMQEALLQHQDSGDKHQPWVGQSPAPANRSF